MIIGHAPAGYIISKSLAFKAQELGSSSKKFIIWGVLGAVAPDFDLLYYYLVDHRHHHHHFYTHFPITWLIIILFSFVWFRVKPSSGALALIFAINGFIHLILDTIVGGIFWFYPFVKKPYSFFTIHSHFHPLCLNYLLHWAFIPELILVAIALRLWRKP